MLDTIFAPLTIKGKCSVYVIRISGSKVLDCMSALGINNKLKHKNATLVNIKNKDGSILDEAIAIYFKSPNSFTGENVCELNLHCSTYIINKVFNILSEIDGVRIADNGEFSKRAFLNNKLDLTQAEAILDLINSETEIQHKQAIKQLKGENSKFFENLREEIVNLSSSIEANIDFPDDVNENINLDKIKILIDKIKLLLKNDNIFKKIKDGLNISIIGEPNVGKSSLLNYLANKDVAIVSDIAGTTRDIIKVSIDINGFLVNFFDTAGIRETKDEIEKEGVKRAIESAKNADIKILMLSVDNLKYNEEIEKIIDNNTIIVVNKIDKLNYNNDKYINISIKNNKNMNLLINKISSFIEKNITPYSNTNITQERYSIELKKALNYLEKIDNNMPIEIIAENIRSASFCIGKITGHINTDEILSNIFSKFCIGK